MTGIADRKLEVKMEGSGSGTEEVWQRADWGAYRDGQGQMGKMSRRVSEGAGSTDVAFGRNGLESRGSCMLWK